LNKKNFLPPKRNAQDFSILTKCPNGFYTQTRGHSSATLQRGNTVENTGTDLWDAMELGPRDPPDLLPEILQTLINVID